MGGRTGKQRRRRSCQISAKEGVCPELFFFFFFFWWNMKKAGKCLQCHGNWGFSGCQQCHHPWPPRHTVCMVLRLSGLYAAPAPFLTLPERTLANGEKTKQIHGKINITEDSAQQLWHTGTHTQRNKKTSYSHCRNTETHKTCSWYGQEVCAWQRPMEWCL